MIEISASYYLLNYVIILEGMTCICTDYILDDSSPHRATILYFHTPHLLYFHQILHDHAEQAFHDKTLRRFFFDNTYQCYINFRMPSILQAICQLKSAGMLYFIMKYIKWRYFFNWFLIVNRRLRFMPTSESRDKLMKRPRRHYIS